MNTTYSLRFIQVDDAEAALAVYAQYVLNTAITFEYEVPSIEEFTSRITSYAAEFPWLVCLEGDTVVGYAYAGKHRARSAYQWSPESTIYLSEHVHGKGIARILYEALFAILRLQGYYNVYAGVLVPNEKSEKMHLALGFEEIGIFKKVGYKHGAWHDVKWLQLHVAEHIINPPPPKPIHEVINSEEVALILQSANSKLAVRIPQ